MSQHALYGGDTHGCIREVYGLYLGSSAPEGDDDTPVSAEVPHTFLSCVLGLFLTLVDDVEAYASTK